MHHACACDGRAQAVGCQTPPRVFKISHVWHPNRTHTQAKRFATDECFKVALDAQQLLGGYGYLSDFPVERLVRDLRVHSILEGGHWMCALLYSTNAIAMYVEGGACVLTSAAACETSAGAQLFLRY